MTEQGLVLPGDDANEIGFPSRFWEFIEAGGLALREANDIESAKGIHDQAVLLKNFARQRRLSIYAGGC